MGSTLLYGFLGGLLPDVIRLISNRHNPELPAYLKSVNFYLGLVLLVLLGGGAVYLLQPTGTLEALSIGYSAPQLVSSLLAQKSGAAAPEEAVDSRGGIEPVAPPSPMRFWGM